MLGLSAFTFLVCLWYLGGGGGEGGGRRDSSVKLDDDGTL